MGSTDQRFVRADDGLERGSAAQANTARMYDYFLGGRAHFAPDREAAKSLVDVWPHIEMFIRLNRAFLARAVRYLVQHGVDQFLDLGSGIPTVGNVHEIAHRVNMNARVAYTDIDPVTVAHGQALLGRLPNVTINRSDIRQPSSVLTTAGVARLIDFTRPLGVLAVSTLPYVGDDAEVVAVVKAYRDACPPGSYLVATHSSPSTVTSEQLDRGHSIMRRTLTPVKWRTPEQIRNLFDGYSLIDPGLVLVPDWRPHVLDPDVSDPALANTYGAVGYLASASYSL